jgi:hypothetical protein
MSQYDFGTIDPYTDDGVALADMLNQWRDAVHSWHRGSARPSYAVPGMAWVNDVGGPTNWQVMVYMGPTAGDILWFVYNTTTGKIAVPSLSLGLGGPKLVAIDANTIGAENDAGAAFVAMMMATRPNADNGDFGATTKWVNTAIAAALASGSSISVGTAPPASPAPNALWWKSDDGVLYINYNDGNTTQWVPVAPQQSSRANFRTYDEYTAITPIATAIPNTDVLPLATAGTNIMSRTVTIAAGQRVRARFQGFLAIDQAATAAVLLTRTGSPNALRVAGSTTAAAGYATPISLEHEDAPGPGTFTYGINAGTNGGTLRFNSQGGVRVYGGGAAATLTLDVFTP